MTKPMSAENLILCLAGDIESFPALVLETIKEDQDVLAIVRQYGKGQITYEEVLNAVSSIC